MSELYFVRHGQAAFGTDDYDRLTPLGIRQSRWLGGYFAERGVSFDRVLTGSLLRHRETFDAIQQSLRFQGNPELHPGLDEYAHEALHGAYLRHVPAAGVHELPNTTGDFYLQLEQALHHWAAGHLAPDLPETWQGFIGRVRAALAAACVGRGQRVLVVSSGGPMAMALREVLELTDTQAIRLNMQIRNTAFSHFYFHEQRVQLASFNNLPHLDRAGRRHAITLA
ncbi:MAG: histidine phosphatase family protein [Proteobacteria bacterium]|nr:histidine phosphatase family protein [Pseudomonadota bacterium]